MTSYRLDSNSNLNIDTFARIGIFHLVPRRQSSIDRVEERSSISYKKSKMTERIFQDYYLPTSFRLVYLE